MKGGKTLENGKSSFSGSIRHLIPAMCPHGSLGQHLVMRFTEGTEPFPSPSDFELWVTTPMWPGNDPRQNVSYSQQAQAIKHYLEEELGIHVRKVTHIFRVLAARDLDEAGIDDKVTMVSSFANVESCAMLLCKLCTMFLQQSAWLHPDRIEFSIWG